MEEYILEWENLKSNLFEMECKEVARWQQNSRASWLKEGNKPKPFFLPGNERQIEEGADPEHRKH